MKLSAYYYNDTIVYRAEFDGGSIECSNRKTMAFLLARYFWDEATERLEV